MSRKDPTAPLWRAAVLLRVITLVFAAAVVGTHHGEYASTALAWTTVGAMAAWTAVTSWYYLRPDPAAWFTGVDLAVCCAIMALSRFVLTEAQLEVQSVPLVPTVWVTAAVAVGAVRGGPVLGTVYGGVISVCNYVVRGYVDVDLTRDMVLLVGVGFVLGLAARTSRRSAERLERALRVEAATAERERLARSIHDGVLQVLARVGKRGRELGGEAEELASLAARQEIALRALVSAAPLDSGADEVDLRGPLQVLATDRVQVSVPATPVVLPGETAAELGDLAREALANVERHAGGDARAWVLLEDLGGEVVLSVRDDGVGIAAERLAAAEAQGRMGVARSIRGRAEALGGTAALDTAPNEGTEWEVRVPRRTGKRGSR
ncbi:MacS family sensor histidine kinase [Actinokineospora guangxiensis]|uniref:MacS family sensor histidine kinase n=1 Tax=Actinokineospora guangxiensis TaxID=1490288 RepID=A0ABW0EJ77_9PSEU